MLRIVLFCLTVIQLSTCSVISLSSYFDFSSLEWVIYLWFAVNFFSIVVCLPVFALFGIGEVQVDAFEGVFYTFVIIGSPTVISILFNIGIYKLNKISTEKNGIGVTH